MLFDLRDPRRKNAIRVIYATLAVLMGGGLILFGIGGEVSGGLLEGIGIGNQGSTTFDDQIEEAEERIEENPRDQQALIDLVQLHVQAGNSQLEIDDQGNQVMTSDAEDSFDEAADAWDQYLQLNPRQADSAAAVLLGNSFFLVAQYATSGAEFRRAMDTAVGAQRVAASQNPIVGNLRNLAIYLYLAGEFEQGDRVAERAAAKAPRVRGQLEQTKQQARQIDRQIQQEAQGAAEGGNPLEETGGLGGGGLSTP